MRNFFYCLWITGLSGSGKTTLAINTKKFLSSHGHNVVLLDGDTLRNSINSDLNFTMKSRDENVRRVAEIAKLLSNQSIITIASVISPTNSQRQNAREIFGDNFHLIYLNASLERCLKLDSKGLYKKARNHNIENFTGMTSPFEEPKEPNLEINTDKFNAEETSQILIDYISKEYNY